jgi:pyruvoyl-dependent arginine decarboxylase (PvlArgDC)
MFMSPFDDDKKCCLEAALQDGGEQTFNLSNKDVHISSIQPVPDHVKQELNPLEGEQTSTSVSKFSCD